MNSTFVSKLFDEKSFYPQFLTDLENCRHEVIIESPYITLKRSSGLIWRSEKLVRQDIPVYIITKEPMDHVSKMRGQAETIIGQCEKVGIQVFVTTNFSHRKLAVLDRKILWEGSLNILSQTKSRELMRRIESAEEAINCLEFTKLSRYIDC